jgi:hypothetical protein
MNGLIEGSYILDNLDAITKGLAATGKAHAGDIDS